MRKSKGVHCVQNAMFPELSVQVSSVKLQTRVSSLQFILCLEFVVCLVHNFQCAVKRNVCCGNMFCHHFAQDSFLSSQRTFLVSATKVPVDPVSLSSSDQVCGSGSSSSGGVPYASARRKRSSRSSCRARGTRSLHNPHTTNTTHNTTCTHTTHTPPTPHTTPHVHTQPTHHTRHMHTPQHDTTHPPHTPHAHTRQPTVISRVSSSREK